MTAATTNQTSPHGASGTRRLPRAERRVQLLDAAASAFLRGGFDGTSMEEVAETAGVTRLIVYRNFGTKEELYRSVLRSVVDRLREEFDHDLEDAADPDATGRPRISERMLRVARGGPDGFRLLWRQAEHEPLFATETHEFREMATVFAESLLEQYGYVHDPVFRRWAATTLVAHVYEAICNWLDVGDPDRDPEFLERLAAGLRSLVAAWS